MLTKTCVLIEALNARGVRYCHWKSNAALTQALSGETDLDLLVHRQDAGAFRATLAEHCFQPAAAAEGGSVPSTEHYFGLDAETGVLVHVHAYFRVITGESLAKNYCLPIEDMLLAKTREEGPIHLPAKGAELVVFTIRMMLKHTTLVELALLARDGESMRREATSLIDEQSCEASVKLAAEWLPAIDPKLFAECVAALHPLGPLTKRLLLARRLRSALWTYARHRRVRAAWAGLATLATMSFRRLVGNPKRLSLRSGGALVAFVGPEATGKSTLIGELGRWLGEHLAVTRVHAGKPPATIVTFLPSLLVPLLRLARPAQRSSKLEALHEPGSQDRTEWIYPLSYAIRSVLLAYDRRALLARAFARASNGAIVLCDRYPYVGRGTPDGPRLIQYPLPRDRYPLRNVLAAIERRLYRQIPPPDLMIALTVPVEVAIARNRTRGKHEPEDYVRRRHSAAASIPSDRALVCSVDTNRPFDDTLREIKAAVWSIL